MVRKGLAGALFSVRGVKFSSVFGIQ